jgi:glycosyltransferase involved in cell wall biosynthesis
MPPAPSPPISRIALFLPFLGGRGAQRVLLNLANGFAAAGRPVDLVLAEAKGEFLDRVSPSVRLVDLKSPRGVLRSLPAYRRYLRRERPAVLLTAMDYINVLSVLTRAMSSRRTKLFVSCHNSMIASTRNSPWARDRLLPMAMRLTYRHADGVIAVSGGVADTLAGITRLPRGRIKVIHNPVITPGFEVDAAAPVDHPWFQPGQPPVVLGVGSLTAQKDFGTLLRAFALVRAQRLARLLILGEGEARATLEKLAVELGVKEDVAMPGWVANPYAYMARAGVFVLSSRWEGFGLVIAEALACGTPVVSTDCPSGPAEILDNGRHGILVPVQDPDALAKAILSTLGQAPDRDALRRRARDFTLEKVVREYLNYFDSVTA